MQANPILEGWGNAKTLRNNNSSRFGKFIELLISASNGEIVGSSNTTYLLEKSRVVFQEEGERNYHVFYQLLFGAPSEFISKFHLEHMKANPEEVMCINQSGCMFIDGVDDGKDFEEVNEAQREIGFDGGDYELLMQAVAGILHLNNIQFIEDPDDSEGTCISSHPQDFITKAGLLFGLELENFTRALMYKSVRGGGRRTSVTYKKYTPEISVENRNALAKEIYRRCFDYIVAKINSSINAKPEEISRIKTSMIGILDIFGFEIFKKNSFEQLCINLANEALQKHFNTNIFEMEMSIYTAEDIIIPDLSYKDNEDVLDLVIKKPKGLIPLLDEEGQVPRGSWEGFLRKFTTHHAKSPRLKFRQGLQLFTVVHYAGDVAYDPSLFIIKNKDTLSADLAETMRLSTNPLIQKIFDETDVPMQQNPSGRKMSSVAAKQTVGTNFRIQLDNLIANLNTTVPKYIRCIKPNAEKKPNIFDSALTNEQLTYSGVFEAVLIMQNGYPFRLGLQLFKEQYHMLIDYKSFCEAFAGDGDDRNKVMTFVELLKTVDETFALCHVGKTMVFYRVEQHRLLEKMRKEITAKARNILHKNGKGFVARNLYQLLLFEKRRCSQLILAHDARGMRESADTLSELKDRMNTTFPSSEVQLDAFASVAYDYADAIELEQKVNSELHDLMDPKHDVFEVFDKLGHCIDRAKALEFSMEFQSHHLSIKWQKNEVIASAIEKVAKFKNIIAIKNNLEASLAQGDDVELEKWLQKLEESKKTGEVDSKFCSQEYVKGTKIVKSALQEFNEFVGQVNDAILNGRFTYKLDSVDQNHSIESFVHFQLKVDATLLTSFLDTLDEKYSNKKQSVRLQRLVNLCRQLGALRIAAKNLDWDTVNSLLPSWRLYAENLMDIHSDNQDIANEVTDLLDVVPEFVQTIGTEILAMYDCTISCLKFRDIIVELKTFEIPEHFQLNMNAVQTSSRVEALIVELTGMAELAFISEDHQHAIRSVSERIHIRRMICCHRLEDLRAYLSPTTSRTLSSTDVDILSAQKWLNFFDACEELWSSLQDGVPVGTPGLLDFEVISASRLRKAINVCSSLEVHPSSQWCEIVESSTNLLSVWSLLQKLELKQALEIIENSGFGQSDDTVASEMTLENETGIVTSLYTNVLKFVKREYQVYSGEINSRLAIEVLLSEIKNGAVSGEIGNLNIEHVSVELLEECLATTRERIILTDSTIRLLEDCKVLIHLRRAVKASEWDSLLDDTATLYESSLEFSSTHPSVIDEFEIIHGEAQDLQSRRRISDILLVPVLSVSSTGEVVGGPKLEAVNNELNSAIKFCLSQKALSMEANLLLASAVLVACARKSLRESFWEDETLGVKGVDTCELSQNCFSDKNDFDRVKMLSSLMKPLKSVFINELDVSNKDEMAKVSVSIDMLLAHSRAIETHDLIRKEINVIRVGALERRCRLILIVALSSHRIGGELEHLKTESVSIEHLLAAVEYVKRFGSQLSQSTQAWIDGALCVLNFRIVLGSQKNVSSYSILSSYFSGDYIRKCETFLMLASPRELTRDESPHDSTIAPGFPVDELQLVVNYITDCLNITALVDAINVGRVQFYENKFDTKMVSYSHLLSAITVTKSHKIRSDRLDRLMFYAELCVFLRQALLSDNWETSSQQGKSKRGASVRQCLVDYTEANVFFKIPMENIPPPFLKEEFHITRRELERQNILLGFSAAFQSGRVGGVNGCLQLHDIKYQRLADQVDKSRVWSETSGIQDFDLDLYVGAAQELIALRKRVIEVHNKYKSEIKFPKSTNSLRTVLQSGFISDSINHAVARVEGLGKHPYILNSEWTRVEQVLSKIKVAGRLRSTRQQVELVAAETFQRNFCGNVLHVLHGMQKKMYGQLSTRRSLNAASFLHGWCRSYAIFRQEMDKQSNNSVKPDTTTEMLYKSSVALTHLLRAESNNQYDSFERTWLSGDQFQSFELSALTNHSIPPTFNCLATSIDKTEHSVQSILRSITKWPRLHPVAMQQIKRAIRHVEDEVTVAELSAALNSGKVEGLVGKIKFQNISLSPIRSALERAINFSTPHVVITMDTHVERNFNGRFRYSPKLSPDEIAHIERTVGVQKVCASATFMKILYGYGSHNEIALSLKSSNIENNYRHDVLKLRHTCELIYELREAIRKKHFSQAYGIIYDNIGMDNQSFKDLIDTIYAGNFNLHHLGVEEFSLMAFEVFENYCCQQIRNVLVQNTIAGARTSLNLFSVHQPSYRMEMQSVLSMVEGLVEVSPISAELRQLCFLINHMREAVIEGSLYKEQESKIATKRFTPIPNQSTNEVQSIMKLPFLKDAMNNAFACVKIISPDCSKANEFDYKRVIAMQEISRKVKLALTVAGTDILNPFYQEMLLKECGLVNSYCTWHIGVLSIQRILHVDMSWYSFSTGRVECDKIFHSLLKASVVEVEFLNINRSNSAENSIWKFYSLAKQFCDLLEISCGMSSNIEVDIKSDEDLDGLGTRYHESSIIESSSENESSVNDAKPLETGSNSFHIKVMPMLLELIAAVDAYISSSKHEMMTLPSAFLKQIENLRRVSEEHTNYRLLLNDITDSAKYVIGRVDCATERTVMSPLNYDQYPDPKPNQVIGTLQDREMLSLRGNNLKNVVVLQWQLRHLVLTENFERADDICRTLAEASTMVNLHNPEYELIQELISSLAMKRQLEQGIICCILPPVAGWSGFTSAPSLALSIVDYPLREALQVLRSSVSATHGVDHYNDSDDEEDEEDVNPLLDELGTVGSLMLSVIGAVRRQVWMKGHSRESDDNNIINLSREKFVKLFPSDLFSDVNKDTKRLENAFDDVFLSTECLLTVQDTLKALQTSVRQIKFMSSSLREFVEYFISTVQLEQDIFELSSCAFSAIAEQNIIGMPGCVECSEQSVQALDNACANITVKSDAVESSPSLKRILQSLKLLKLARMAIFDGNWSALGPILDTYVYMRSLDKYDSEKNCADLMYFNILDNKSLLKLSSSQYESIISETIEQFKKNVNDNKVSAFSEILNETPTEEVQDHVKVFLNVESFHDVLQSIPDLEAEMKLLNNHYFFEKATHFFNMALATSPAHGTPGDLTTEVIRFDLFHEVSEILMDNGLLSYPSGKHLHRCSLAMVELRMGQRSGRLNDIRLSLDKLNALKNEESKVVSVNYLIKALSELELARTDLEQQELSHIMYNTLIDGKLPSEFTSLELSGAKEIIDKLGSVLKESARRKVTSKRCRVLFKSIQLLIRLWGNVHTRSWDDMKDTIASFEANDSDEYDEIMVGEVECAHRLMNVTGALDVAEDGIHNGKIIGTVEKVDLSDVSIVTLLEAKHAFTQIKSEWKTAIISTYDTSCTMLASVRECATKGDWSKVYDLCTLALTKHNSHFRLIESALEEITLARNHAAYVVVEGTLVDALMNGRMDGDVGEIRSSTLSTQFIRAALEHVEYFDQSILTHRRLAVLKDTVELVLELRQAQLQDTWMLDPSRADRGDLRLLPDPDTMAVTMSLVPLNWLASSGGNIMKNIGMTGLSALMKKYLGSSKHLEDAMQQASVEVSTEVGEAGWLLQYNALESDDCRTVECGTADSGSVLEVCDSKDDSRTTVEDVLTRAAQLEESSGTAPEAMLELAFAREEINHRHIVQMLLAAMTSQGFVGQAGKLDGSSMDLHPLERAIMFAESDIDNSDRGKCKWMLRDAKLLFKARKFRVEKNWPELNAVLVEVTAINMSKLASASELDEDGLAITPRPILPFAWKEISLIQADMHFYTCLSEFAQEMTSRAEKSQIRCRRKGLEAKSLTGLLRVLLRTLSAAELHPSMEFDRLLEAENVALELRTHMTFDSLVSPREVILKVLNIRERDKRNHVPSYVCLLMPDISRLSDVLDTEQLVESLETSITKGQHYLRAALGFIESEDIDLDGMRGSIHTAMPLLSLTGSKEHLSLLSVATAILAIRTEVVAMNWPRVDELLAKHDSLLQTHETILQEEISRLHIEIENYVACRDIEKSLMLGRCKDVYELVNKLSTQKRSSISRTRSGSVTMRPRSRSASVSLSPQHFNSVISEFPDNDSLPELDRSIEDAMQIRNRSTTTTTMLRAAVLIRSLRAAIQTGNWEEVQGILDEEASYLRFPQICQDEIKEVKAAMSYRTCMSALSKGIINGSTTGMPGELNISHVDCVPLEDAMKLTKTLEIVDPATTKLLEIGHYICSLRHAVLNGRWFKPYSNEVVDNEITSTFDENISEVEVNKSVHFQELEESVNSEIIQRSAPFSDNSCPLEEPPLQESSRMEMDIITEEDEEEDDEDEGENVDENGILTDTRDECHSDEESYCNEVDANDENFPEEESEHSVDQVLDIEFHEDASVEELLTVLEKRILITNDLKQLIADRSTRSASSDSGNRIPDWIEIQLKAVESVVKEINLLQVDLNERRRVDILVSILEIVPVPTREFNRIENAPSLMNAGSDVASEEQILAVNSDVYHIISLETAIAKAQAIPGEMMKDTTRILNTAELILSFRKTMKSMEIENFKALLTKAKEYATQGKLSLHYGLYELNSYRSATMTVTLTKAELLKALECGRVSGPLHKLNIAGIEIEALEFWVTSCSELMGMSQELLVGLLDAYQEARVMLELRKSVVADNWDDVDSTLDKYFDQLYKFEFGAVELKHIQYASKYRIVEHSINEILDDKVPDDSFNLPGYILPKMEPLEKALIYGQRIIEYQAQHLSRSTESIPAKGTVADAYGFDRTCQNAESVFNLWKSILSKSWQEEIIASGQVHLLPRPNDPLLNVYFESVRQHEVSQRLGIVHEQLAVLNLTGEKTVKNLRASVRMSMSVMNSRDIMEEVELLDNTTDLVPSIPKPVAGDRKKSIRSSLSLHTKQVVPTFEEKQKMRLPSSALTSEVSLPKPVLNVQKLGNKGLQLRRKSSIGGMISKLFGSEIKPKTSKKKKSQHRNLSVVLDRQQSYDDSPSVAMIVCGQDWNALSALARLHFENARNILVNKVTVLRIKWGCKEGCAVETAEGNISLQNLNVELLLVALADCRRVSFYSHQAVSKFKFSDEVETMIQLATILSTIRSIIMANRIDELMDHLRLFDDLSDNRDMNLTLSKYPDIEKELRLFDKFSHEYVAEKVLHNALQYLASVPQVDSKTAGHRAIIEINNLEKKNRSIGEMTQAYCTTVKIAKLIRQSLISSVMCNSFVLRELEGRIFKLVGEPGSNFGGSKKLISKIFAVLRKCASIRFVGKGSIETNQTVVSRRFSVQPISSEGKSPVDISLSTMYGALGSENNKVDYFDENKAEDLKEATDDAVVGQSRNDRLSRMQSLPSLLMSIADNVKKFEYSPHDVYFGTTMHLISKAHVEAIEDIFSDTEFLYLNIWLPANEGILFDPLWILVGQSILESTRSSHKLLSLSSMADPDSVSDVRTVKALAGTVLQDYELLHQASLDFLLKAKAKYDRTSKRVNPNAGLDLSLCDISTLINSLDMHVKSAQVQITLAQREMLKSKPISLYGGRSRNSMITMVRPSDSFDKIILDFQDRITGKSSHRTLDTTDVRFDRERYQKRLVNTCTSLLQIQGITNTAITDNREKEVRHAVMKRRRQFMQSSAV